MFAIIRGVAALVFALLGGAAVAKRTGVEGVPAKKKPKTEPPGLQLERSPKEDKRAKLTHEEMLAFHRLFHPELHELEAKPKKKPDSDTDPFDFQRERSMEMSSGIEPEADKTAAHTNYLDDKREEEIKKSQEIIDLDLLMDQEPQPKKKSFRDTLREQLKDVKPLARDLSRDRDRGMER